MYFEDYMIDEVRTSRGRTITEADIVNFAGLSGDFVELHMNEEYARTGPFGKRIAHGALVFSISTGLMVQMTGSQEAIVAFRGVDQLRFAAPVFIGDTIHVVKKTIDKQTKDGIRGLVTFETTVLNQDGKPVLTYFDRLMIKCRAH
ncbi:MAG TPA: MaoC/PaaZ C-terminal domain-containing protein [Bryobacteraceae bacterium]|jgi:3-hydroxybutyryl-CoA dehydratase|nr:MaoC/PaaZ C-terminal domain-containing protein [Bryobacteraceae bacterium]